MSDISKTVLDKIEKKEIHPTPKWQFILWHVLTWILFGVTIVLGSIATGIALFNIFSTNWELVPRLKGGPVGSFFIVLPFVWFGLLSLMIFLASKIFAKTKKGYRINPWLIGVLSVVISLILGSVLFATKTAQVVEQGLRQHLPPYKEFQELREKIWHAPENGVLPGKIIEIKSDKLLMLNDLTNKTWEVDIKNAKLPPEFELEAGLPIVVVGQQTGENEFNADIIKPGMGVIDRLKQGKRNGVQMQPPIQPARNL